MYITLKEYAEKNNLSYGTVRNAVAKGLFIPDKKENGHWYVDENRKWYAKRSTKKGNSDSYTRLYNIWRCMKQRCYNKNNTSYYRYGGRGIKVCDEWVHDSKAFMEWAKSHGYTNTLELDRIDNDGDYTPSNCQWITHKENMNKAPRGITYRSDEAYMSRFYNLLKKHNIDPEKYDARNPYL